MSGGGSTRSRGAWRAGAVLPLAVLTLLGVVMPAHAQDVGASLGVAEAEVSSAEAQVAEAETEAAPARARYAAATSQAVPARREAREAREDADRLEASLDERQRNAAAQISELEADRKEEVDDRDEQVAVGIGLAVTAAVLAAIAFGWSRFGKFPPVVWLGEQQTGQAVGLCVFGGLALVVIGAALAGAGGVSEVIGTALVCLGIGLPVALLPARRSYRAGGDDGPSPQRRAPAWAPNAVGAGMVLIGVLGLVSAVSADAPDPLEVPPALRQAAAGENAAAEQRLADLRREADRLRRVAATKTAKQEAAREDLGSARRALRRSESRLAGAEGDVRRYGRRLAAQESREARELEEAEEDEAIEAEEEGGSGGDCDPNYVGACLDPSSPDYDCAGGSGDGPDYTGPVQVVGSDPFGLDSDGDGFACE